MTVLLDVNCLVSLFDPSHVNHEAAHAWFGSRGRGDWATCPITENGCIRVLSNPAYPAVTATPLEVITRLGTFCSLKDHRFWPDDISLLEALVGETKKRLSGHQQLTDFYLAALAHKHAGKLATFDGSLAKTLSGTPLAKALEILR